MLNLGIGTKTVDRIYQALYVHSVGMFHLLKEVTGRLKEGKEAVLSDIWRVFQILLEYSCRTEYQMITQKLIDDHEVETKALNKQIEDLGD